MKTLIVVPKTAAIFPIRHFAGTGYAMRQREKSVPKTVFTIVSLTAGYAAVIAET